MRNNSAFLTQTHVSGAVLEHHLTEGERIVDSLRIGGLEQWDGLLQGSGTHQALGALRTMGRNVAQRVYGLHT